MFATVDKQCSGLTSDATSALAAAAAAAAGRY